MVGHTVGTSVHTPHAPGILLHVPVGISQKAVLLRHCIPEVETMHAAPVLPPVAVAPPLPLAPPPPASPPEPPPVPALASGVCSPPSLYLLPNEVLLPSQPPSKTAVTALTRKVAKDFVFVMFGLVGEGDANSHSPSRARARMRAR